MSKIDEVRADMVKAMKAKTKTQRKLYPCCLQLLRIKQSTNVRI